jgi:hypothetical protein
MARAPIMVAVVVLFGVVVLWLNPQAINHALRTMSLYHSIMPALLLPEQAPVETMVDIVDQPRYWVPTSIPLPARIGGVQAWANDQWRTPAELNESLQILEAAVVVFSHTLRNVDGFRPGSTREVMVVELPRPRASSIPLPYSKLNLLLIST